MDETNDDTQPLRAIVADDDAFARRIIRSTLQDAGIVVVAEADTGSQAVELTLFYGPDVVLMDVVMPELDGISATRRILKGRPEQIIILLTSAEDGVGLVGLQAGAFGFLNKDLNVEALPRAIFGAMAGEAAISRSLGTVLVQQLRRRVPSSSAGLRPVRSMLTSREWEVFDLLCERKTTDAIADELFLSVDAVKGHLRSLFARFGIEHLPQGQKRARLVAEALQSGLVTVREL